MIEHKYQQKDHEGFDAGHRSVVRNNGISRDARLLFVIINSFSATREGCYIGNGRLAFYMGCDPRSIRNWIAELRDAGVIKIHIINANRRRIEICSSVDNGEYEEENSPGTDIPTPRNAGSYPQEQTFHIGNGAKVLEPSIPSGDGDGSFFKREKPLQIRYLPKDCLQALKNAGIDKGNIQRVAEHFELIRSLAKHPKTTTLPRRCVAAARALETDDDWKEAEKSIPTAILTIKNDRYLPGIETWLERRMWRGAPKQIIKKEESPAAKTVRLFLDFAFPDQHKRFFEKQAHWREYVKNTGCTPDELADKIQIDIEMDGSQCGIEKSATPGTGDRATPI